MRRVEFGIDFSVSDQERTFVIPERIVVKVNNGRKCINIEDIYYIKSDAKYSDIHYKGGVLSVKDSLTTIHETIGNAFMRIHRKILVNLMYVQSYTGSSESSERYVVLSGCDDIIPLSRRGLSVIYDHMLSTSIELR